MERRARLLLVASLALSLVAGCATFRRIRDRLGLDPAPPDKATPRPTPRAASPFPAYLLDAFPEAKLVQVDLQSPHVGLAAESVLTHDDPHLHRGPPRFSPDGRLLAYEESNHGGDERWMVIRRLDGAMIRKLRLDAPGLDVADADQPESRGWMPVTLSWSPSSDAFTWTRETTLGAYEAVLADLAGDPKRVAGPPAVESSPLWSPAGDRVVYLPSTHDGEIWTVDPHSHAASRLAGVPGRVYGMSFSGDGRHLAFSAGEVENRDIWVLDLPEHEPPPAPRKLVRWAFDDIAPSYSPDGKRVAFFSNVRPSGTTAPGWSLLCVSADGGDAAGGAVLMDRILATRVLAHPAAPPAWSSDSRWVAVVEPQSEDYRAIVLIDPELRSRDEMAADEITNEDVAVSADGVLAYRAREEWGDDIVIALTARGVTRTEK
jgi:dipeptidyl aminopeptidase/acylaminoacyl peptidase